MKKILTFLFIFTATFNLWAGKYITYTATRRLPETTSGSGLHTNAFNVSIYSHTFFNGKGTITFYDEVGSIGAEAFYGCSGLTSITIPNSVTSIGDWAFFNCSGLTSITIPSGVYSIGSSAFSACFGLTSITIPNSVTSIGDLAFYYCSGLTSITIPNSVTNIGERAFSGCSSLTSIIIDNGNTKYDSRENCNAIIKTTTNALVVGCKHTTIPNSVTSIGDWAFSRCTGLTSITIPESVTHIGDHAFEGCSGLTSITIPNSVTSIGNAAFEGCSGLTSITIPNSVTSIGKSAFYGCSGLTSITIPNGVTSIGDLAFYNCANLKTVYNLSNLNIVKGSTDNGYVAYYADNVCIPCHVSVASSDVQRGAVVVTMDSVTIPTDTTLWLSNSISLYSNPEYGYHFVQWSDGNTDNPRVVVLTHSLTLTAEFAPNQYTISATAEHGSVTDAGAYDYLTPVELTAIPDAGYHFVQWSDGNTDNPRVLTLTQDTSFTANFALTTSGACGDHLTWVYDEEKMVISGIGDMYNFTSTTMPWILFRDSIENVVIEHGATSIGDYAFYGCNNRAFTKLVMPQSVKTIGDYAFANCNRLSSVVFSNDLEEVGDYAFSGCTRINDMTCYALMTPDAYDHTFDGVNTMAYLYVQAGSARTYKLDPYWGVFDIQEIGSDNIVVSNDQVLVVSSDNEATIIWPTNSEASSYILTIYKDGEVFCILTFNADGQLTNITFAPGRDGSHSAATVGMAGMLFTLTGLDAASKYTYYLTVTDASSTEIVAYSGEFATNGYEGEVTPGGLPSTTGLRDNTLTEKATKIFDGTHNYILRGGKRYTMQGQEVR